MRPPGMAATMRACGSKTVLLNLVAEILLALCQLLVEGVNFMDKGLLINYRQGDDKTAGNCFQTAVCVPGVIIGCSGSGLECD